VPNVPVDGDAPRFTDELNQPACTPLGESMNATENTLSVAVSLSAARHQFFRIIQLSR
jgi:hypothetical protein